MKRSKVITAVIAIIAVVAATCVYGYVRSSPPMSRKSLLLPSRRTRPAGNAGRQQFRQTVRFKTDEPATYSRKTPIRAARSRSRSTFRMNRAKRSRRLAQTRSDDSTSRSWTHSSPQALCPRASGAQSSCSRTARPLDMNAASGEAIRASGTAGETLKIYALVGHVRAGAWRNRRLITVDGKVPKADMRSTITRSSQTTGLQRKAPKHLTELFRRETTVSPTSRNGPAGRSKVVQKFLTELFPLGIKTEIHRAPGFMTKANSI